MLLETFASEIVELVSAILPNRTVNIMNTDGIIHRQYRKGEDRHISLGCTGGGGKRRDDIHHG